jgi:hypothetical protein
VKLHGTSQQHALALQQRGLLVTRKQHVQRGEAARKLQGSFREHLALRRPAEQPRPAYRGEGHRAQQLGVVIQAMALVRLGPGPVEDVFAV